MEATDFDQQIASGQIVISRVNGSLQKITVRPEAEHRYKGSE